MRRHPETDLHDSSLLGLLLDGGDHNLQSLLHVAGDDSLLCRGRPAWVGSADGPGLRKVLALLFWWVLWFWLGLIAQLKFEAVKLSSI